MLEVIVNELVNLAIAEKWDEVDAEIPKVRNNRTVLNWAYQNGLYAGNENVRDLSASILEKAEWPQEESGQIANSLRQTMDREIHVYAKFRMACALYNHGERTTQVINVLEQAPNDVKEIAQKYLEQK